MVYHSFVTTHSYAINATEDCIIDQGFGNCDEVGSLTSWRNGGWHEPDPVAIGQPYYSIAGYQEGKRRP